MDPVDLLPHRPPFLFVDEVLHCEPGASARARWRVTGEEPWLAGHFPDNPVVPGVIQLEALAQTGAVAVLSDERFAGRLPLFGGAEAVRFPSRVGPGDELLMHVELERMGSRGGWGRATAQVGDKQSCRARLMFVLV